MFAGEEFEYRLLPLWRGAAWEEGSILAAHSFLCRIARAACFKISGLASLFRTHVTNDARSLREPKETM
eukprot:7289894-Prymnesium_polylepis.1